MVDSDIEYVEGLKDVEENDVLDKADNLNHRKRFYCFTPQHIQN